MLNNPYICQALAYTLLVFGGYLAVYNTAISAIIIGDLSGLGLIGGFAIAISLTGVELWFASWARDLSHWQPLMKKARNMPHQTYGKMALFALGLALIYHFDIDSTRRAIDVTAKNFYFFLWGVTWLIFGPELAMTLSGWLLHQSKRTESKYMKANNARDAERLKLKTERNKMLDLAEEVGKEDAIRKISDRYGPSSRS